MGFPYFAEVALSECCARVETFTVKIDFSVFWSGRTPFRAWTEEEIGQMSVVRVALGYRHLKRFRVINGRPFSYMVDPEGWSVRNLENIEVYVRQRMRHTSSSVMLDDIETEI